MELIKEVIFYDLDNQEKQKALYYLKNSQMNEKLKKNLEEVLVNIPSVKEEIGFFTQMKKIIAKYYKKVVKNKIFSNVVVYVFVFWSIINLVNAFPLFKLTKFHFWDYGIVVFTLITNLYILKGIYLLIIKKKRLEAYKNFKTGDLISIFFTHFFLF